MQNAIFFDTIDSEAKAYWLGFFYADGHSNKSGKEVAIVLGLRDAKHLAKFAAIFGRAIHEMTTYHKKANKMYTTVRCVLYSKYIWQAISRKGIPQQKTGAETSEVLNYIPREILHHFVRGYFDGDGHIGRVHKAEYRFVLCGSYTFLSAISTLLSSELGVAPHQPAKTPGIYKLAWGGIWQLNKLRSWLYKDATIYLERKKDLFDEMPAQRGTSRFQGVYWHPKNKIWVARIFAPGKTRHIGCYLDEIEAALAYDEAARHYYGQNAKLNLPQLLSPVIERSLFEGAGQ